MTTDSTLTWTLMRPTITCGHCGRRGRIQRRMGIKSYVTHHCPGPYVLATVRPDPRFTRATWRLTITPRHPEEAAS